MKNYLSLVKFTHTIFALPFALVGFFIPVVQEQTTISLAPHWRLLGLVLLCMVFARSAAMGFNRYLDRHIDAANPRTKIREIPAGIIAPGAALAFVLINCGLFILTTWFINPLCFYLSPVALAVVLGYSYTKRFTWLCHLVLGLGLGLAPVGAYLAVTGHFDLLPILYGAAVLLWTAGFDVIYALQDVDFDRSQGLYSMPSFFGKARALRLSEFMHLGTAILLSVATWLLHIQFHGWTGAYYGEAAIMITDPCDPNPPWQIGWLSWLALAVFLGLLIWQHLLVKPDDLRRVNLAFFTTNGVASLLFGALTILDLLT